MKNLPPLAPCLIGNGTVTNARDMLRALETLEGVRYAFVVDGQVMSEGRATLVKLMADDESATVLVNACLFLNVGSFRYLDFTTDAEGDCSFCLIGDGMKLTLTPADEADPIPEDRTRLRMLNELPFDEESVVALDEEDDEE